MRSDILFYPKMDSVVDFVCASDFFIEREQMFYDDRDDGLVMVVDPIWHVPSFALSVVLPFELYG